MSTTNPTTDVLRNAYQKSVANYWNENNQDPVNLVLGEIDGLYHHHYGVGQPDLSVLEGPEETRDERIINELHRLETAQAELLLDFLGDIQPEDHLLDAGSGRGALSIMANRRFGCHVDGVTISEYQVGFANERAAEFGVADRVKYHFRNMLDTQLETSSRQGIWTDETTMYVDLHQLFTEFSRRAGLRWPVRLHHRLLQRRDRALAGRARDRPALHLQHPPAKRVLQGDGGQQAGPDPRRRPDARHDPVLGAAGEVLTCDRDRRAVPRGLPQRQLPVPPDRRRPRVGGSSRW